MIARPRNIQDIAELQKALGIRSRKSVLALSEARDPFNTGSPANYRDAEWFAKQWDDRGFTGLTNIHLRKNHYKNVVLGEKQVPLGRRITYKMDGKDCFADYYENTDPVWSYLSESGAKARYLGLVPPDSFVDRRNPKPIINSEPFWTMQPSINIEDVAEWTLPSIQFDFSENIDWRVPSLSASGYWYDKGCQPYMIELWCEKSTMDDIIIPLCNKFDANYVPATGFQSITGAINLLQRAKNYNKPVRIFYISDFDPAGDTMPVAVSRQIEYWFEKYSPGVDIKVKPLVLTLDQINHYELPDAPIKGSDKRAAKFEALYGVSGAVELDALDAIHPGELEKIISGAFKDYRDPTLADRLWSTRNQVNQRLESATNDLRRAVEDEIGEIRSEAMGILGKYQERLQAVNRELQTDFAPLQERLNDLRRAVEDDLSKIKVELPDRPKAKVQLSDKSKWLFDSDRNYIKQLRSYKDRSQCVIHTPDYESTTSEKEQDEIFSLLEEVAL